LRNAGAKSKIDTGCNSNSAGIARAKRRETMQEQTSELKKLAAIAADLELPAELRTNAIEQLGRIGSHEALLVLLDIVASEKRVLKERDLALKQARGIIKAGH